MQFTVSALSEAAPGRINVTMNNTQYVDGENGSQQVFGQSMNLNLSTAETQEGGYWPGAKFDVSITAVQE